MAENQFELGSLKFWALGDRIIILEDSFRSGYECPSCNGERTVMCTNCGGFGERGGKKCSHCDAGRVTCPECRGKGGLLAIPEVSERRPTTGTVVSVGEKVKGLKVGDSVLYSNMAGYLVELNRAGAPCALRIIHESEVLAGMEGHLTLTNLKGKTDIPVYAP